MLIAVSSISGSPGVSSWSLLFSAAWPGDDQRNRVLVETDSTGGVLPVRYGLSPTPGIVELISNVRQGIGLRETLMASAHRLDEQLWAVPAPSSADAAWPILVRMGDLGPVLSSGNDIWFVDCGRWWPSSPCIGITSAADLNLILVDAEDSSLLSVRSRVHHFRQFGKVGVVVVGSTQRSLEELEMNFGADKVWNIPHIKQLDILAGQAATTGQSKRSKSRRSKAWRQALKMSTELRHLLDSAVVPRPDQELHQEHSLEVPPSQYPQNQEQPVFQSPPVPTPQVPEVGSQMPHTPDLGPPPVRVEAVSSEPALPVVPVRVEAVSSEPALPVVPVRVEAVSSEPAPPVPPAPLIERTEIVSTPMPGGPNERPETAPLATGDDPAATSISSERYDPALTAPTTDGASFPGTPGIPFDKPASPKGQGQTDLEQLSTPEEPSAPPYPEVTPTPNTSEVPPVPTEASILDRPAMPPAETAVPDRLAMPPIDAMTTLSSAQLSGVEFHVDRPSVEEEPVAPKSSSNEQPSVELKPHGNKSLHEIAATTSNVPGVTRVINAAAFAEDKEEASELPGVTRGVPGMPPVRNVTHHQGGVNPPPPPTTVPDNVTPIHPADPPVSAPTPTEPPNANYFYDAPTLLPTKKSTVSPPEPAAPSTNGAADENYGDNGS